MNVKCLKYARKRKPWKVRACSDISDYSSDRGMEVQIYTDMLTTIKENGADADYGMEQDFFGDSYLYENYSVKIRK